MYKRQAQGNAQGGGRRRIITLERPRNEHIRPVNITVQRMYFGDWTVDNLSDEGDDRRDGGYAQRREARSHSSSSQGGQPRRSSESDRRRRRRGRRSGEAGR